MKKWEYKIIERQFNEGNDEMREKEAFLNAIGKLGWELISMRPYLSNYEFIIKREIPAKRKRKKSKSRKVKKGKTKDE